MTTITRNDNQIEYIQERTISKSSATGKVMQIFGQRKQLIFIRPLNLIY